MSFFHKMIYIGSTYISILRTPPPPSYYKSPCQWQRKPLRIPLKQVRRKHFRTYMFVCSQTWPCFGSWDTLSLKTSLISDGKPKHYWLWIINFQMHRAVSGLLDTQKKYWLFCRHGYRYGTPSSVEFSFWK